MLGRRDKHKRDKIMAKVGEGEKLKKGELRESITNRPGIFRSGHAFFVPVSSLEGALTEQGP